MEELTTEQKTALQDAKTLINDLIDKHGEELGRWALNRRMREIAEKAKLERKRAQLEEQLAELNEKID